MSLFGTLLSTNLVEHTTLVSWFVFFAIIGFLVYVGSNRRLRKLNDAFGWEIASYDQQIKPLEEVLEILILETINAYKGHFKAIRSVATMVSTLNDATMLYRIKPHEKLIKTKTFDREINQTMQISINFLKGEANYYYKNYKDMNHNYIPIEFRTIIEKVFKDNEVYLDLQTFRSST